MKKRLLFALLAGSLLVAIAPGAASANDEGLRSPYDEGPNQGAEKFVTLVDNEAVTCDDPIPMRKREGDFGRRIFVRVPCGYQIDAVTVKSGKGAEAVWFCFFCGERKGMIKYSKDISNYVVWKCPVGTPSA